MPDIYKDEKGKLVADLNSGSKLRETWRERSGKTEYGDVDLASGYPKDMIWTTADGRRIAIPNLSDDHLLNILAYVRSRCVLYKRAIAYRILLKGVAYMTAMDLNSLGEFASESAAEYAQSKVQAEIDKLVAMDDDKFIRSYMPIYSKLYQEAYKRKILIEGEVIKPRIQDMSKVKVKQSREELLNNMYQACITCGGIEVPIAEWNLAEELVKQGKCTLGSARGPDNAWKRLEPMEINEVPNDPYDEI